MNLKDSPITEDDFRAVVRILADVAEMDASLHEKRDHLLRELGMLLKADDFLWGVVPFIKPGAQPACLDQNPAATDDERMALVLRAMEHPATGIMTDRHAAGGNSTRLSQDVITDECFHHSNASAISPESNVGPILFSLRTIPGVGATVVGFFRAVSAPCFDPREARIARIVLSGVGWLHEAAMPQSAAEHRPKLPPRCHLILNQLVRGTPRKEIAADLGISLHTVNGHLKQIYRHFGVRSQVELVARFSHDNRNDH